MKKIILFSLMLVCFVGFSQVPNKSDLEDGEIVIDYTSHEQRDEERDENYIYNVVEVMPEYLEGGNNGLREFIAKNYKSPKTDRDINGRVMVQFIVEKDGSLSDIKILRELGYGTGAEAVRVLKRGGKWKAGMQNGKPVRVLQSLPIIISIKANQE